MQSHHISKYSSWASSNLQTFIFFNDLQEIVKYIEECVSDETFTVLPSISIPKMTSPVVKIMRKNISLVILI